MPVRIAATLVGVMCLVRVARADDWPQWLGPERDSVWRDARVPDTLTDETVQVRWRRPVGGGYAGPAVAAGRVPRVRALDDEQDDASRPPVQDRAAPLGPQRLPDVRMEGERPHGTTGDRAWPAWRSRPLETVSHRDS